VTKATRRLTSEQQAMVAETADLVEELASIQVTKWPGIERGEFLSVGHEALVEAACTFKEDVRVPFRKFAYYRVRGEMRDRATSMLRDWMRRRALDRAEDTVSILPAEEPDFYADTQQAARARAQQACDGFVTAMAVAWLAGGAESAEECLSAAEEGDRTRLALRAALQDLSPDERHLVELRYLRGLPQREVATELRISQRSVQRHEEHVLGQLKRSLMLRGVDAPPPDAPDAPGDG
jgi:RNA polymerase sigma factor (sigma-70 family)